MRFEHYKERHMKIVAKVLTERRQIRVNRLVDQIRRASRRVESPCPELIKMDS